MDRSGCLKGTRMALLDEVERWAEDLDGPRIFWLNGLVGTGKSTIAQTVAERCFAKGKLGASYFFSHHLAHDDPSIIFPTLAFQLAQKYTNIRSTLIHHLQSNPDITYESCKSQAERLIIDPLQLANVAMVIVIDALDECKGENSPSEILLILERVVKQAPGVKFFITSRPEPMVERGFSHLEYTLITSSLHDIPQHLTNNDLQLFLKDKLPEIATQEGLDNWPTGVQLDLLCNRAGGLFTYAVATIKFLDHWNLVSRYNDITEDPDNTSYEGKVDEVHRGLSLDSLCTSIIHMSFKNNTNEEDDKACLVLDAALTMPPCSLSTIPKRVHQQAGKVVRMNEVVGILKSISSLIKIHKNHDYPVCPFHKLLPDCLADQNRCPKQFLNYRNQAKTSS